MRFRVLTLVAVSVLTLSSPETSAWVATHLRKAVTSVTSLVFKSIGIRVVSSTWTTNGTFYAGPKDGMLNYPVGVAVDAANDLLYVADNSNNRIVKLTASTGAFVGAIGKTTASTGTCPAAGVASSWCTGGTFTSGTGDGMFSGASGLALDTVNDRLYVVELGNRRIVKLVASTGAFIGAIGKTTASTGTCPAAGVASGWCTGGTFTFGTGDGMFYNPQGIAIDVANDALYIADRLNNRIVKVTASTGAFIGAIGKTTASTGSCPAAGAASGWCTGGTFGPGAGDGMLNSASGVAIDSSSGALLIADNSNQRIVKVNASTGAFIGAIGKTVASTGTCPATGAASGWCTGGTFSSGLADGMFNNPFGLVVDPASDVVYIADWGSGRIIKTTASTGAFVGAIGKTTSSTGTCATGVAVSGWCTGGTFGGYYNIDGAYKYQMHLAVDTINNALYTTDSGNNRLVKVTASTGAFVGAEGGISYQGPMWAYSMVSSSGSVDGALNNPAGVAHDAVNDFLYIADTGNNRIVKVVASTGAFIGAIGKTTASTGTCPASGAASGWCTGGTFASGTGAADGMFNGPNGVAVDPTNNVLYIADTYNNRIVKVNASTGAFVGAIGRTSLSGGTCPASSTAPGWCTGGQFQTGTGDGQFQMPSSLVFDSTNNILYVADFGVHRVVKITASTGAFVGAIGQTTWSTGTCPMSGAAPSWCTGGTFSSGSGDGMFNSPYSVALNSSKNVLYIADASNHRIVKVTASTGAFVGAIGNTTATTGTCPASGAAPQWCTGGTFASGAGDGMFNAPKGVEIDSGTNALYVSDTSNNRIAKFYADSGIVIGAIGNTSASGGTCPAAGAASKWCSGGTFASGAADGMFSGPWGIVLDSSNKTLYVADYSNHRISRVDATASAPTSLMWAAPAKIPVNSCVPMHAMTIDSQKLTAAVSTDTAVTLTISMATGGAFYADAACSSSAITSVTIPAGSYYQKLYFKSVSVGTVRLDVGKVGMGFSTIFPLVY